MGGKLGTPPKSISEEMGPAVLLRPWQVLHGPPCALARKISLRGLEVTQTILTASILEQGSLKRAGIYLSLQERSAGGFGLICRRKECGWEDFFARLICLPARCSGCCKSVLKNLWLMRVACGCSQGSLFWGETFLSGP